MAAITITTCRPVEVREQFTGPAGEAIAVGQFVRLNTTTGKIELGNSTNAAESKGGGIALHAAAVGDPLTVVKKGSLDVGNALTAIAFGGDVYLNDADGTLGDAAGTVSKVVGTVIPVWGFTTADKLLRVDL